MLIEYRKAADSDLDRIAKFADYWLGGKAKSDHIPLAGKDFFIPIGQHKDYLRKQEVWLALCCGDIVGWSVKTVKGVLIHLLIAATFRGQGIGTELLRLSNPATIRSKWNQSSGDPRRFYERSGFELDTGKKVGRRGKIQVFVRSGKSSGLSL